MKFVILVSKRWPGCFGFRFVFWKKSERNFSSKAAILELALFLEAPSDADVMLAGDRSKNDRNDLNKCNFGPWLWYR